MRIEWDPRAVRDLEEIRAFIAADKPDAAVRVAEQIKTSVRRLSEFPHLGRQTPEPAIRILSVSGTPYMVYYQILLDHLEIRRRLPWRPPTIPRLTSVRASPAVSVPSSSGNPISSF